jgi:type IV pilus assembly protein PilB
MQFGKPKPMVEQDGQTSPASLTSLSSLLEQNKPVPIIEFVNTCIEEAITLRSSDIHFSPNESEVNIRLRIDGLLQTRVTFSKTILPEVISRIKVLANLRTDEHQAAQDGRFRHTTKDGVTIDVRVSITPTYYGENAVLRLLVDHSASFTLDILGFSESDRKKIEYALTLPHGMILATGPTGSGKTTTLYTIIKMLNRKDVSIITIEDPIEYAIPGVTQIQINPRTGLIFASGLRSILRQDPNIIMVGEVRDGETASIAVNTALTGHLLLSTIHTNDSATTLPRLLDMGIDAYLVASTVHAAIGQRLVRKICAYCKESYELTDAEMNNLTRSLPERLKDSPVPHTFYRGVGCMKCEQSGFQGRVGIYEVLVVSPRVREAILQRSPSKKLPSLKE